MLRVPGFFMVLFLFIKTAETLRCFNCDNQFNPACGVYFKPYQFKAHECPGYDFKCALQRQTFEDGWVGIVRICYQLGSLPDINETNGCKNWTNGILGYTAHYCFCDTDYCNTAISHSGLLHIATLLYFILWIC